jgi:hypothetical protein
MEMYTPQLPNSTNSSFCSALSFNIQHVTFPFARPTNPPFIDATSLGPSSSSSMKRTPAPATRHHHLSRPHKQASQSSSLVSVLLCSWRKDGYEKKVSRICGMTPGRDEVFAWCLVQHPSGMINYKVTKRYARPHHHPRHDTSIIFVVSFERVIPPLFSAS